MRPNCCHVSLSFVLKLLNFLQAFIGVSILVYSAWMLNQWNHHIPIVPPPPSAPSPDSSSFSSLLLSSESAADADQITPLDFAVHLVSGFDEGLGFGLNSLKLPAPWFIYSFMGLGILLCCVTFIGCIAAAAINGCCLCFYTILITMLTLLEAALVAFILIDRRWEKVLSLLLSITLRGMLSTHKPDYDVEDDYDARARTREPLLKQQLNQASGSTNGDGKGTHSDIWSSRIRDKYGLSSLNQNASPSMQSKQ
ncbi:unnamed protein product [Malus baccata var. baccata]